MQGRASFRLVAALVVATAASAGTAGASSAVPRFADGHGVHVVSVRTLSPRLLALRLTTPLLTAPTDVRVLLPADYARHPAARYPVLWLFHGTSGGAADWTSSVGRAQDITRRLPLIVVMPDAGVERNGGSWFTDWYNAGRHGPPRWETWHIGHLIPWVDSQLRTIAARRGRAIAGLSQGGFGTYSYAARHPDMFEAAFSFSGALDIAAYPDESRPLIDPVITATEIGLDHVPPGTFFGPRETNEVNWAAHDPATLAGNLGATYPEAFTGNGAVGPLDGGGNPFDPGAATIEAGVHRLNLLFMRAAAAHRLAVAFHDYGPGTHSWPYWQRDLRESVRPPMRGFAHPRPAPARVTFSSDAARWSQWGWTVALRRPAREFSTLRAAGAGGFTLTGSGTAAVTTPASYRPGAAAVITRRGTAVHDRTAARVGRDGRLRIAVPLGPGNRAQQYTAGATTKVYATTVAIRAPRRAG